jgi:hypothetical protein
MILRFAQDDIGTFISYPHIICWFNTHNDKGTGFMDLYKMPVLAFTHNTGTQTVTAA